MDEQVKENGTPEPEKSSPFFEMTRKLMLAAIGAAAIAQEELESFANRLVERGELAEKDARRLAQEMREKRERVMEERRAQREQQRRTATREEVEALTTRLAELNRELEELKRAQGGGTTEQP